MKLTLFKYFIIPIFAFSLIFAKNDSLLTAIKNLGEKEQVAILHNEIKKSFYSDNKKAEELSKLSLEISQKLNCDSLVVYSNYFMGLSYYFLEYWKLSAKYYKAALKNKWIDEHLKLKSAIANNLGIVYEYLSEYDNAAKYYLEALKIAHKMGNSLMIARANMNLGLLFIQTKDYDKAKNAFLKSLPIFIKYDDKRNIVNCYQNLGLIDYILNENETGKNNFEKSLKYAELIKDSDQISKIYFDYAGSLFNAGDKKEALKLYQKALSYLKNKENTASFYYTQQKIGLTYMALDDNTTAEKYLTNSQIKLKTFDSKKWIAEGELALTKLFAKMGNWNEFNKHLDLYDEMRSDILKEEEIRSFAEMHVVYDTDLKNSQILLQKVKIKAQRQTMYFLWGILSLLVSIVILLWYLNRKIKERNIHLINKNIELSERWKKIQSCYINFDNTNSKSGKGDLFSRIVKLLNEEKYFTRKDLTVDVLAKQLRTNIKYISSAIKSGTGMNFNTFINTYRIEEAKQILSDSEKYPWTIEAIAEKCGFNNTTTFFQTFKKMTGLTPASYRNIVA